MSKSLLFLAALILCLLPGCSAAQQVVEATFIWTAPGDDGDVGQAASYDLRISLTSVGADTTAWRMQATPLSGMPAPALAGTPESFAAILSLAAGPYSCVLWTADGAGNESGPSNVAQFLVLDKTAPGRASVTVTLEGVK